MLKRRRRTNLLEATGLDWLPVIVNPQKLPTHHGISPEALHQLHQQIQAIDANYLDDVVAHLEQLVDEEDKRRLQVEGKATSLISYTAVASSLVIGFTQFNVGTNALVWFLRLPVTFLYICLALAFVITVVLATHAIKIATFQYPEPYDMLRMRDFNRDTIRKQRASSLLNAYTHNQVIVNKKITYVRGAQDWFRNAVLILVLLLGVLAFSLAINPSLATLPMERPLRVILVTPTPLPSPMLPATSTLTPEATSTLVPLMLPRVEQSPTTPTDAPTVTP